MEAMKHPESAIESESDYMVVVTVTLRNWRQEQDLVQRYLHLPVDPAMAGGAPVELRRGSDWVVRRYPNALFDMIHSTYAELAWLQPELPF